MSARLIKGGADSGVINFVPFIPQDVIAPQQSGTVIPFAPQAKSQPSPFAPPQAQIARRADEAQAEQAANSQYEHDEVTDANAEAERIIAEAQAAAKQVKEDARARGMAEARAAVEEELALMVEPLRQLLAQTVEEVSSLRPSIVERAERDMVKLAIEIAKKVVHREVTIDNDVALTLARVALGRIHNRAQARVHLHPDDFAYVAKHLDRLTTGSSLELVEDRAVSRGGCLVETEMGDMDARIEQQFEELERSFLGM